MTAINYATATATVDVVAERKGEMKGLLKDAKRNGLSRVIMKVPVSMLAVDRRYQTDCRTKRDLKYLTHQWDERKLLPLTVVPHEETGEFMVVDGYGRWQASQAIVKDGVAQEPLTELEALIILNAPTDPEGRLEFEAELYMSQGNNKQVTPLQCHGAKLCLGDTVAKVIEELQKEYGFGYMTNGNKENAVRSYPELYRDVKQFGRAFGDWYFTTLINAGMNRKVDGYGVYLMRAMKDLYKNYPQQRMEIGAALEEILRPLTYRNITANSISKYPLLGAGNAVSFWIEDQVVNALSISHVRKLSENGNKLEKIA